MSFVTFFRNQKHLLLLSKSSSTCCILLNNQKQRYYSRSLRYYERSVAGPKVYDLIKTLPIGVKKLYHDYLTYQNIQDAAQTKNNKWCHHIPRCQQQQQKRFLRDLKKVLIPVSVACLPMIGNFFIPVIAINPRLFLSDHFFTTDQIRHYISNEYTERKSYFVICNNNLWYELTKMDSVIPNDIYQAMEIQKVDNAGAVFCNVIPLYLLFQKHFSQHSSLTRSQILNLAYATWLSSPTVWMQPTRFIQCRLASLAKEIIDDDVMLMRENNHLDNCKSLTYSELLEACWMRSLPCGIDQSIPDMRESLTNHLLMMEQVFKYVGNGGLQSIELKQFILHLPIVRCQARQYS